MSAQEYVTINPSVVSGYFHESRLKSSSDVFIVDKSEILAESLDCSEYHCNEINAIVQRIANIVITTINSTNVNPFLFIIIFKIYIYSLLSSFIKGNNTTSLRFSCSVRSDTILSIHIPHHD